MAKINYNYVKDSLKSEVQRRTEHMCFRNRKLKINCYKKARVFPYKDGQKGEIITNDLMAVATDFPHKVDMSDYDTSNGYKKCKRAVFVGDFWIYVWGHCFTDHYNKIWFALTEQCKALQNDGAELIFIGCSPKIPKYFYDLFSLAGVDLHNAKMITEPTIFEELYVPDNCYYILDDRWYRYYTDEYLGLLSNMKINVTLLAKKSGKFPVYKRIYLTRTQGNFGSTFKNIGEKTIENIFRKEGYTIIAPEKYSVAEQIWMMMNCDDLVATDGSICHASCFCRSTTHLTVLLKADFLVMHQVAANQIAGMDVAYVTAHHSTWVDKVAPWHGPFYMYVTKQLQNYLGKRILHIPYFASPSYFLYFIRHIYMMTLRKSVFCDRVVRKILRVK